MFGSMATRKMPIMCSNKQLSKRARTREFRNEDAFHYKMNEIRLKNLIQHLMKALHFFMFCFVV